MAEVMHDGCAWACVYVDVYVLYGIVNLPHCCRLPSSAFALKHARKYYHTENHIPYFQTCLHKSIDYSNCDCGCLCKMLIERCLKCNFNSLPLSVFVNRQIAVNVRMLIPIPKSHILWMSEHNHYQLHYSLTNKLQYYISLCCSACRYRNIVNLHWWSLSLCMLTNIFARISYWLSLKWAYDLHIDYERYEQL